MGLWHLRATQIQEGRLPPLRCRVCNWRGAHQRRKLCSRSLQDCNRRRSSRFGYHSPYPTRSGSQLLRVLLWNHELARQCLPSRQAGIRWRYCRARHPERRILQGLNADHAASKRQLDSLDFRSAGRQVILYRTWKHGSSCWCLQMVIKLKKLTKTKRKIKSRDDVIYGPHRSTLLVAHLYILNISRLLFLSLSRFPCFLSSRRTRINLQLLLHRIHAWSIAHNSH